MSEDEVTIQSLKSAVLIAGKRFTTLAQSNPSAQDVMRELAETVMPCFQDAVVLLSALEEGVLYAQEEIERIDEGEAPDPESQLLPEDAARYTNFLEAILEQAEGSLKVLDPGSNEAKATGLVAEEARALILLTNELTVVPEGDDDDDETSGETPTGTA